MTASDIEEWRKIDGFPDYAVSSLGSVMSWRKKAVGHMLKPALLNTGYYMVGMVGQMGRRESKMVHRLVCTVFHGLPPSKMHHAAHSDGNPINNRADNLRWATPAENSADRYRHNTVPLGERHHARINPELMARGEAQGASKLTTNDVLAIRADNRSQRRIARDFGVSQSAVGYIKRRATWSHI